MPELKEGSPAPDFALAADDGKTYSLSGLKGKTVVLYWYPKDMTPGCTVEACSFRDLGSEFEQAGAVILGVSPDDTRSHEKFRDKHGLTFPLLSDTDNKVAADYGVWVEKSNYGKKYMGIERSTFVIGPDGTIKRIYRKVKPEGHPDEVLAYLKSES